MPKVGYKQSQAHIDARVKKIKEKAVLRREAKENAKQIGEAAQIHGDDSTRREAV